ncbi:DUF982 domain-containing protein [Mesorhizobium sp. ISC11]|uniref:DUF982 domain-containing protein n=1 Tax=Mesorhizobium sp. ISC11 TaxID=3076428 RepID=UPI00301BAAAD
MDAIEFLEEWPVERRGLLHGAACDTCYSAYDGRKSVEAAHKAFAFGAVLDDRAEDWQCTRTNR